MKFAALRRAILELKNLSRHCLGEMSVCVMESGGKGLFRIVGGQPVVPSISLLNFIQGRQLKDGIVFKDNCNSIDTNFPFPLNIPSSTQNPRSQNINPMFQIISALCPPRAAGHSRKRSLLAPKVASPDKRPPGGGRGR